MKNLAEFTDAMHAVARENDTPWEDYNEEHLLELLDVWSENLEGAEEEHIHDCAIRLALIAAEIAGRVE